MNKIESENDYINKLIEVREMIVDQTLQFKLKSFREIKGLSQKDLSVLSKVSESSIQKYELGVRVPKLDTLKAIAKALEIPVMLFYNEDYWDQIWPDVKQSVDLKESFKSFIEKMGFKIREYTRSVDMVDEDGRKVKGETFYLVFSKDNTKFYIREGDVDLLQKRIESEVCEYLEENNIKDPID